MEPIAANAYAVRKTIKNKRLELNYTQQYLAKKLNITQNAYSRLEAGINSLNICHLVEIADVLEISLKEMFAFTFNETD